MAFCIDCHENKKSVDPYTQLCKSCFDEAYPPSERPIPEEYQDNYERLDDGMIQCTECPKNIGEDTDLIEKHEELHHKRRQRELEMEQIEKNQNYKSKRIEKI